MDRKTIEKAKSSLESVLTAMDGTECDDIGVGDFLDWQSDISSVLDMLEKALNT